MNSDLISREALKKEFEKIYPLATNEMGGVVNKQIYDIIDNAPTVPLPDFKDGYKQAIIDGKTNFSRPTGEWIGDTDYESYQGNYEAYKCSVCGYGLHWRDYCTNEYNYCPNCGAKMKGGETNDKRTSNY